MGMNERLAKLEDAAAAQNACPRCRGGQLIVRREADMANWPKDAGGNVTCPGCGQRVHARILRRGTRPAAAPSVV